ncbi:C-C chemokine receptor type 8 [Cherax quadricarinatus]
MNVTANCSEACPNCTETGEIPPYYRLTSPNLLLAAIVHCYVVFVLGSLGNSVALWCVVTCNKTKPAVKLLLYTVFLPLLLLCLVTRPLVAHIITAILTCDVVSFNSSLKYVLGIVYSTLAQMELLAIAAVSFFRMKALWSPQVHILRLRVAVAVVVSIGFFAVLTTLGVTMPKLLGYQIDRQVWRGINVLYFLLSTMVPVLVTVTCYALIILAMRRNQCRLASNHTSSVHRVEATRSMLAVCISNLFLSFPHSVFHLLEDPSFTLHVIFHMLFYTHFIVDPIVFVGFNQSFRHRVVERVGAGVTWMTQCCPWTSPTSNIHSSSVTETTDQKSSVTVFDLKPSITVPSGKKSTVTETPEQKSSVTDHHHRL